MLLSFLKRSEAVLTALSGVVEDAGHSDHMGSPREFFLFHFLRELVGDAFGIATGEIIDEDSKPKEKRRQNDIVIYDKHFPKLHLGGGCYAFFAESVIATIEVKSELSEVKLAESLGLIADVKKLKQNRTFRNMGDYHPPGIVSYVFAYKGPADVATTFGHVKNYIAANGVAIPKLPTTHAERMHVPCPLADCICVLNQGAIHFDNAIYDVISEKDRAANPNHCWISVGENALFWLYLHLTGVLLTYSPDAMLNPWPYLKDLKWKWTFDEST